MHVDMHVRRRTLRQYHAVGAQLNECMLRNVCTCACQCCRDGVACESEQLIILGCCGVTPAVDFNSPCWALFVGMQLVPALTIQFGDYLLHAVLDADASHLWKPLLKHM
jgi:hypothetical protein